MGSYLEPETLGRGILARSWAIELASLLEDDSATHTFGIVGAWGSGKTWLLDSTIAELKQASGWSESRKIVHFNPWLYSDEDSLYAGFASLLIRETLETRRARATVAKLLQVVGPSAKFGPVDISSIVKGIGDGLQASAPGRIRSEVGSALENSGQSVLIVMDDLDRLAPAELLQLFKLVRLVGELPGLSFLFAYDEDTLIHLLEQTPIASGSGDRARRYLEKMVEYRWAVPPLTLAQCEALVLDRLPAWGRAIDGRGGPGYRLQGLLSRAIQTPRAASRFIDKLFTVNKLLFEELNHEDLYLAVFTATFAPRLWTIVIDERSFLVGVVNSALYGDADGHAELIRTRFTTSVVDLGFGADLVRLIVDSFPSLAHALDSNRGFTGVTAGRLGHPDFVDHYLWFELPPGAVSDRMIRDLVRQLPSSSAVSELGDLLDGAPRLAIASIERCAQEVPAQALQVLNFLEDRYEPCKAGEENELHDSAASTIAGATSAIVTRLSPESLARLSDGKPLVERPLLRHVIVTEHGAYSQAFDKWKAEKRLELKEAIASRLPELPSPCPSEPLTKEFLLELSWIDRARMVDVLIEQIRSGRWLADDVASLWLGLRSYSSGARTMVLDRSSISPALLDTFQEFGSKKYPRSWITSPPESVKLPLDDEFARQLAQFALERDGEYEVRVETSPQARGDVNS